MSAEEVMVKIKKEIIDEVTFSEQKCDINLMWDINEINYDVYKTEDDSNNGQKLTISEIKCETSDINNVVVSESEIKHQDENEEEDYGLCHDCPYGNLLAEEDCAIPQSKMTRRKFLFSPRHFTEQNEFTYSTSSVKKLTYSKKKHVYSGPGNYNIKFFTGETLKVSNLSKPINNSHLPIKARIKNSKIELKQSLSTSRTMNLNSMSVYPSTLTNNTLTPFSTFSNTINVPKMSINNDTIQNNVLPKLSIRPTFNSDCWYDPVSDLEIPYIPMLPGLNLLSK